MPSAYNSRIVYTLYNLKIAVWDGSNYGSPIALADEQTFTFEPQVDEAEMKSGGIVRHLLAVATHITGTLSQGRVQEDVQDALTGITSSESGSSGSRQADGGIDAGADLDYFGAVGAFHTDGGGNIVVGVPLCKPSSGFFGFTQDSQNDFIMQEASIRGIANDLSSQPDRIVFRRENEAAALVTDFDTFFGIS